MNNTIPASGNNSAAPLGQLALPALKLLQFEAAIRKLRGGRIGVVLDEERAVREMMAHLVSLGHRRIAHIKGHPEHGASQWRLNGYRDGLDAAGIAYDPGLVIEGDFHYDTGAICGRTFGGSVSATWLIDMIQAGTALRASAMASRAARRKRLACLPDPLPRLIMWSR